jgi:hypothetical protein
MKETHKTIEDEIAELDAEVANLEREKAGLLKVLSWDDLQHSGALKKLEEAETRRRVLPKVQRAARAKRLQLEIRKHKKHLEPIYDQQAQAWNRLEEARQEKARLTQVEADEYNAWHSYHVRIETLERRIREATRALHELEGHGHE